MGRQSRTKRNRFVQKLPCMSFTLEQLLLLRKALAVTEQVMEAKRIQDPKLPFALETTLQVQRKINDMISQGMWGTSVGFDCNEMVILRSAVRMFMAGMELAAPTSESKQDRRIANLLSSILSDRPADTIRVTNRKGPGKWKRKH